MEAYITVLPALLSWAIKPSISERLARERRLLLLPDMPPKNLFWKVNFNETSWLGLSKNL